MIKELCLGVQWVVKKNIRFELHFHLCKLRLSQEKKECSPFLKMDSSDDSDCYSHGHLKLNYVSHNQKRESKLNWRTILTLSLYRVTVTA